MFKALTKTQQNYAQIDNGMLTIVTACERFHQYIYGRKDIVIETDHSPLVTIYEKSFPLRSARLQRILIKFQLYSFNLIFKKRLYIADAVSRSYRQLDYNHDDSDDSEKGLNYPYNISSKYVQ